MSPTPSARLAYHRTFWKGHRDSDRRRTSDFSLRSIFAQTVAILTGNPIPIGIVSLLMTGLYEFGVRAIVAMLGVAADDLTSFDTERAFELAFPQRGSEADPATLLAALIGVPALYFVTVQVATIAISFATFRYLAGRRSDPLASMQFAVAALFPALGIIALVMIFSIAAAAVAWFVFILAMLAAGSAGFGNQVGMLLPLVLLASYALWVARLLRDWVAVPVFVLERAGILESLRRSAALTRGRRGKIFRLYLLVLVLGGLLAKIVGGVIGTALMTAFAAVLVSVVYCRLRAEKEGLTAADIGLQLDRLEAGRSAATPLARNPATARRESTVVRTRR